MKKGLGRIQSICQLLTSFFLYTKGGIESVVYQILKGPIQSEVSDTGCWCWVGYQYVLKMKEKTCYAILKSPILFVYFACFFKNLMQSFHLCWFLTPYFLMWLNFKWQTEQFDYCWKKGGAKRGKKFFSTFSNIKNIWE